MPPIRLSLALVLFLGTSASSQTTSVFGGVSTNLAVGDLNEDGLVDRVLTLDGEIAVELGEVDGRFRRIESDVTGGYPLVWLREVDGDGHLDLVVAVDPNGFFGNVVFGWAAGAGDGSFEPLTFLPSYGSGLLAADVDDLDGDGLQDLVGISWGAQPQDSQVIVHRGQASGGFGAVEVLADVVGGFSLEIADVSGDGRADLIVGRGGSVAAIEVWLADTMGGFVPAPSFALDGCGGQPVASDLDEDGLADLVVTCGSLGDDQVIVYQALGGGLFAAGRPVDGLPAGRYSVPLLFDLDQDGHDDLLVGHVLHEQELIDKGLTVLRGRGDLTFERWQYLPGADVGRLAGVGVPADADLDGDVDLVGSFVFSNMGDGRLIPVPSVPVGDGPDAVLAEDIDDDGRPDLLVIEDGGTRVRVLRGLPGPRFEVASVIDPGFVVQRFVAGHLNADGQLDLVLAGEQLVAYRGDGAGHFGSPFVVDKQLSHPSDFVTYLELGDVQGDGVADILTVVVGTPQSGSSRFKVATGLGDGTFSAPVQALSSLRAIDEGDLDGDGDTDLVISSIASSHLHLRIFLSQGDGSFTLGSELSPPSGQRLLVEDIDGDGHLDVLTFTSTVHRFFRGRGDGTFEAALESPGLGVVPVGIRAAEVTGDEHVDLVLPHGAVLPGIGDGSFDEPVVYQAGSVPVATAVGDWNDDGVTDLAIANRGSDDVSLVLRGLPTLWSDLGGGLAGAVGAPRLVAGGTLEAGALTTVVLTRAASAADGVLIAGARLANEPLAGGILWPLPEVVLAFVSDADGRWTAAGRWPDGLPSGYELHLQVWLVDPTGPFGLAASNGLTATVK